MHLSKVFTANIFKKGTLYSLAFCQTRFDTYARTCHDRACNWPKATIQNIWPCSCRLEMPSSWFVRTNIDRKNENCIGFFHNLPKKAQQSLTAIYSFCPWPLVSNTKWTELLEILSVSLEWMPSTKEVTQEIRFTFESPFRIQRFIQKVYLRCHSGKGPSPTSPNPPVRRASWVTRPLFTAPLRAV